MPSICRHKSINRQVPFGLRREMGGAAASVLLQSGHENKTYATTDSELSSFSVVARTLSALFGMDADAGDYLRKVQDSDRPAFVKSILPAFAQDIKQHQYEVVTEDLLTLLGRKPTPLQEALTETYGF